MVINLPLYLKRGQCIDLSPQKEPASWHGCGGLAAKTTEWLRSCLQVLAGSGFLRERNASASDWCTGAYDYAEARAAREMSPTFQYCTQSTSIRMTCRQSKVLLDWPVSWKKDVLSKPYSMWGEVFIDPCTNQASVDSSSEEKMHDSHTKFLQVSDERAIQRNV